MYSMLWVPDQSFQSTKLDQKKVQNLSQKSVNLIKHTTIMNPMKGAHKHTKIKLLASIEKRKSLEVLLDTASVSSPGVGLTHPQPLVDTLPVELVAAGQHSQQLSGLKITHAHHTPATRRGLASDAATQKHIV